MASRDNKTTHVIDTPQARHDKGKDPITCHVLDTLTGRPAKGIATYLVCLMLDGKPLVQNHFVGHTDDDGRVKVWKNDVEGYAETVTEVLCPAQDGVFTPSLWKLTFLTGDYYGGETFWPQVELNFYVKEAEHYHVPLLLGPYSYTTYRGS